jgi:hypothetical protein
MARELSIVYGALTVGGSSGRELHGVSINTRRRREFVIDFEFDISKTTKATFITEVDAVEVAFRKPYQDLTVTQDGSNIYAFSQSGNTGMDAEAEITKRQDMATGRSRRYGVRITLKLPANTGAEIATGLAEHTVEVAYAPNRVRTVTISGEFTAVPGTAARAQYEAQISALETSVFSALNIAATRRELVEEPQADSSYNNKTIVFRRVWNEIIFSQGGASLEDAAIKKQSLRISKLQEAPGDAPGVQRLVTLNVQYDCWLDKDQTTNILGKYASIRSWLFQRIQSVVTGGRIALLEEEPTPSFDDNRLSVRILCRATLGNRVIERSISIEEPFEPGWAIVHAWTGDPLSAYDYQGPAVRRRIITDTQTVVGFFHTIPSEISDGGSGLLSAAGLNFIKAPAGLKARHRSSSPRFVHRRLGRDGKEIDVTDIVQVDEFQFFKPIASGGGTPSVNA